MAERSADALELLLPEAAPQFWQRAQRVTTFLRLLSDDARGQGGPSVAISLSRARGEFERSSAARLVRIHEELLRHHVYALVGPDSFAHPGECEGELQRAWSELEEVRADAPWVAGVPAPGESAASVAARLLSSLQLASAPAARLEVWQARVARAVEGPAAGEALFERCLARSAGTSDRAETSLRAAALAGWIECALDRGAVRAARVRLEGEGPRALGDPRVRRLAVWVRLLSGHEDAARQLQGTTPFARGRLPRPLAELRARVPAWAPWLAGQASTQAGPPIAEDPTPCADPAGAAAHARSEIGAALLSSWLVTGPGRARLQAHALAPAHRGLFASWLDAREGACADPREPECALLSDALPRMAHLDAATSPGERGIAPSILALAWVPLLDRGGDLRGWLRLEFEHHLVPSAARLERLARAWSRAHVPEAGAARPPIPAQPEDGAGLQAAVLRSFVDGLALKTSQRRWSAFDVRDGLPCLVAQGGGGLESAEEPGTQLAPPSGPASAHGEGRAVARAVATGRSVSFAEGDPQLALHARAASGVAVPLDLRGRVAGVWLVESTRRRDFTPGDVRRFEARAKALVPELAAAQFRAWHRARFGHDAHVGDAATAAGLGAEQLLALARFRAPLALCGPVGSGRRMLARRLHFEGPAREGPMQRAGAELAALRRAAEAGPATWIVEGAPELPRAAQVELAAFLEAPAAQGARLCFVLDRPLASAVQQGALAPELAWALARGELHVAALAQRRAEIAPLARLFLAHFAAEQGARAPALDDGALALLWRQPWEGNVRELAQWMSRLVLCRPEGEVDAELLAQVAQRFGRSVLRRVPSRHPDRTWLAAALECTATRKGSWNKTRAALYLGWDPDTLQSRLSEAGIEGDGAAGAGADPAHAAHGPEDAQAGNGGGAPSE